eukprot:jgi/Bigna1/127089/aug1.3_g1797
MMSSYRYFAKRRNDFVRNDPSVRMTKAHLAKLDRKRKKKFQPPRQDPTKVLLDRAPIDNSTGEIRLRDWSDSEYEEKMVEGDKYQQLYKDLGHSLPHPRFVAKKIRMEKRDKREAINLQPWGDQDPVQEFIQLKRDLNGGREEDNKRLKKEVKRLKVALKHGHDHVVRKVSNELMEEAFEKYFIAKLPRHMRRRLTRVSSREQPALARPHPGELLLPEPRAHAELMVQIAEFESKRDPAIAFQWYKKGAEQGNVEALFKLGCCHYANGEVPVDRNETKAFEYFKLAADLNHTRSKFYTGLALMFGDGTPTNHIAALQYLTDADKEGDFEAKSYIGFAYEEGLGVKQNHSHAVKIYEDCAALGHKPSRERLAQFKRIEKEYDDMHGGPKPPRPGSRAWKFGGGREKHQAMLRKQRRLALLKRAERREMKKKNLDETDPDDWDEERKESARRYANASIEREQMLKERSLKREAIKKFKASRSYVSPSITAGSPSKIYRKKKEEESKQNGYGNFQRALGSTKRTIIVIVIRRRGGYKMIVSSKVEGNIDCGHGLS